MNIDLIRASIAALQDEREAIEKSFPSWDETAAALAADVGRMSESGRRALSPAQLRRGRMHGRGVDALLLAAAFDPAGLTERLLRVARAEFPENGISAADRRRRLAEIDAELFALEIEEERQIRAAATPIVRRGDAHPAVVLAPSLEDLNRFAA
ncbi:MAG: hypothetical protein KFB96_13390 [Thiocapsa sp.]|uniref:hypothetical protein n=1 Tax=Thiocapsa sp. TaxID=2024551 RepID=UPI001BCADB39|nr:hypothetical protein [Thiocapsa sp.]QVL46759.1 MAG: hypothetical protein KFB96_13390 [Thiocapsa sp.]